MKPLSSLEGLELFKGLSAIVASVDGPAEGGAKAVLEGGVGRVAVRAGDGIEEGEDKVACLFGGRGQTKGF